MVRAVGEMQAGKPGNLETAIRRLEDVDGYRNLHDSIPVLLFVASAGLAARSFFWLIDITTWLGLGRIDPVVPSSISFVLLFVVWIVAFLGFSVVLDRMRFKNLRKFAALRLSDLALTRDELRALKEIVQSRNWKHDRILKDFADDLLAAPG